MTRDEALKNMRYWYGRAKDRTDTVAVKAVEGAYQRLMSLTQGNVQMGVSDFVKDMPLKDFETLIHRLREEDIDHFTKDFPDQSK